MAKLAKAMDRRVAKGWTLLKSGRPEQALLQFEHSVKASPGHSGAWQGVASARQALGDATGAIEAFEQALAHAPGNAETLCALGRLARDLKAPEQAAGFFRAALTDAPTSVPALVGLGHALRDLEQQEAAIELLQSAIQMQPEAAPLWDTLGAVMADLEDHASAMTFLNEALRLEPGNGSASGNLAEVLFAADEPDQAAGAYQTALKARPGDAALRFNHALFRLATGYLEAGWRDYEARLEPGYPGVVRRDLKLKRWRGPARSDGRLLVVAEQGVGDELHFLHCLPDVVADWGEVWWECDPRLCDLLSKSFPGVQFVPWQESATPGFHRGYGWLKEAPRFDAFIEAGSLQARYRRRLADFPARPPLLKAGRVGNMSGFRVGISWTSTRRSRLRDRGYVPLDLWGPIFAVEGVEWVSLQYGDYAAEVAAAEEQFGIRIAQHPDLDLKDDFSGTADLMAGLDLVIGPTNAARQLAASLGVPTLVFSRLPYEFGLGQPVNPFYPDMTDFVRLPDKDWSRAVDAVAGSLRQAVREKAQASA